MDSLRKKCTYCDREFNTFPGMRQHVKKAHQEQYDAELIREIAEREEVNEPIQTGAPSSDWSEMDLFRMAKEELSFVGNNINVDLSKIINKSAIAIKNRRTRADYKNLLKELGEAMQVEEVYRNYINITTSNSNIPANQESSINELNKMAHLELKYKGRFSNRYLAPLMNRAEDSILKKRRTADYKKLLGDLRNIYEENEEEDYKNTILPIGPMEFPNIPSLET